MPAKSERQRKFMGYLKSNPKQRLKVGMSEDQVDDFLKKPKGGYKGKKHGKR